jgi:hypothetical protein
MNRFQACRKLAGVLVSPKPNTSTPCSLIRAARRVKSPSDDTRRKAVETARMQVHGVDDQRDIGRILADHVREILMRQTGVERRYFGPAIEPRTGEITLDASYAGFPDLRDFLEQSGRDSRLCVIGIDQHGELAREGRIVGYVRHHTGNPAAWHRVPTGRPDNDCSVRKSGPSCFQHRVQAS